MIKIFEKGFNYSQDGPGNRLVVHLGGCNLFCPWCSNPEGMSAKHSKEVTADELADEIISCRPMFFGGGGVTFTGGECSLQYSELLGIFKKLHENNINIAIESNASSDGYFELAKECDCIITDYKSPDAEKLKKVTGGDLEIIEKNIRKVCALGKTLHLRIPLIHGFNDTDADLDGFIRFFKSLKNFDVEILSYHEYGRDKWTKLGLEYTVTDGYVSPETVKRFTDKFKENDIKVIKT